MIDAENSKNMSSENLLAPAALKDWSQSVLPGSAISVCTLDLAEAATQAQLQSIVLPKELLGAHPRRELSFRAGRACAAQALQDFGCAGDLIVGREPSGLPIWPVGTSGSISHTSFTAMNKQHLVAAAIVAARRDFAGIGIDCETVMTEQRAQTVGSQLALESEYRLIAELSLVESSSPLSVTLLFSAKEAVFKSVYPVVGRMFGFKSYCLVRTSTKAARGQNEGVLEFRAVDGFFGNPSEEGRERLLVETVHVHFRMEQNLFWTLCVVSAGS
jgi:4'-phosphopantetheinyl transferase EntD